MNQIVNNILKGIFLGILYLEITKANDTTLENISLYTLLFVIMTTAANLTDINENVVINAFITKTVFTLLDERVKKKEPNELP